MKLVKTTQPHKHRFADSTVKKITLAEDSTPLVLQMLTEMYEDPLLAMLREYTTNGIDANIEAGSDKPVEITLPGEFEPTLIIRDYGPGMSMERIEKVFCRYTASTKRETNDQAGMYGIGSKCALAYTNQLTVETVNNGTKIIAVITRGINEETKEEEISFEIPRGGIIPTQDPNGTSIQIPIKSEDVATTVAKAKTYFRVLDPGVVTVDGEDLSAEREELDNNLYLIPPADQANPTRDFYVLMGHVAYKLDLKNYNTGYFDYGVNRRAYYNDVVYIAEMGEFKPTTSREKLDISAQDFANKMDSIRIKADIKHIEKAKKLLDEAKYVSDVFADVNSRRILKDAQDSCHTVGGYHRRDKAGFTEANRLKNRLSRYTQFSLHNEDAYTYIYYNGTKPSNQWRLRGQLSFHYPIPQIVFVTDAPNMKDLKTKDRKTFSARCRYHIHKRSEERDITMFLPEGIKVDDIVSLNKVKLFNPDHYTVMTWEEFCKLPTDVPKAVRKQKAAATRKKKFSADEWIIPKTITTSSYGKNWKIRDQKKVKPEDFDFEKNKAIIVTKSDKGDTVYDFIQNYKEESDKLILRRADQVDKTKREFPECLIFEEIYQERAQAKAEKNREKVTDCDLVDAATRRPYGNICYWIEDYILLLNGAKEFTHFKELLEEFPGLLDGKSELSTKQVDDLIMAYPELEQRSERLREAISEATSKMIEYYPALSLTQNLNFRHYQDKFNILIETLRLIDEAKK